MEISAREKRINIRVSEREYEELMRKARKRSMTFSEYLRELVSRDDVRYRL